MQATARLKYPALREPLSSACVGAGALLSPLRGQAGAALFFEDVLTPGEFQGNRLCLACVACYGKQPSLLPRRRKAATSAHTLAHQQAATAFPPLLPAAHVAALHQLGPNYQTPMLACESSALLDRHPAAAAALALGAAAAAAGAAAAGEGGGGSDAAAAAMAAAAAAQQGEPPKLLLAFCPQLAAAEAQDAQAGGSGGGGRARGGSRGMREAVLGLPAALLPGTQLCRTQQPRSMLHCLGGIAALLPLLEQRRSGAEAAAVLRLAAALLRGSPTNQQAMQQAGGFALMEQRVASLGPRVLTPVLLAAQQQLLGAVAESPELSQAVLRCGGGAQMQRGLAHGRACTAQQ